MKSKSIKASSIAALQEQLQQIIAEEFKPTLAIVFLSNVEDAEAVQASLNDRDIAIFGASTSQKFTEEGIDKDDSIVLLLLNINPAHFCIVLKNYTQFSSYEAAKLAGETGTKAFSNPGFIISAIDIGMSGEELIRGLSDVAGKDVTVIGGAAGDPADFSGILFNNNEFSTKGILALVIDQDKIAINGFAVSGWKPIGTEKKITKSDGTWIHSIDDEPALDVIQKFLGNEIISTDKDPKGLIPSDLGYPLQFQKAPGAFLMKPLLLWNTIERSIMVGGQVKEGEHFRFSLPPDLDVIDKVIESTRKVKENDMPEADALIVFSCVGRLGSFGPMMAAEIEGLATTWNKPMVGFFSLGEFGKLDDGPCEFHGTTVSWVAIKEK